MEVSTVAPALVARGVERAFGRVRALDGLDLEVRAGEVLGVVGPNGAGKTTFIRIVAGLLRPSAGTVDVLGLGAPGPRIAPHLGYMTQSPALYEDVTVEDNLVFFARLYGLTAGAARDRAAELLELMVLGDKRRSLVRDLSGGQRQRTNLACAMVHRPRLLMLDEPTVGVDPVLRRTLWDHFALMNREGATVLLTTHVMDEAGRCDRVAMIARGRTIAVGTPDELRRETGAETLEGAYLVFDEVGEAGR